MNKYPSKISPERTDASFQEVNRLFVLSFEDEVQRTCYKRYYLPIVEVKEYNVMIYGQHFFDQPVRYKLITYDSIQKNCNKSMR